MRLAVRLLLLLSICLATLAGGPASALDPARTLPQYKHTRWSVDDGAPAGITALAQGPDGYLWVGAREGLYRFDGVGFEFIRNEDGPRDGAGVSAVLAARDGAIWVGYQGGGVAVLRGGHLRDAHMPRPTYYIMALREAADHAVWAQIGRGEKPFVRHAQGRWEEIGPAWGLADDYLAGAALMTRDGTLWVASGQTVLSLKKGAGRFETWPVDPAGQANMSEDPQGRVWISDSRGSRVVAGGRGPPASVYPTPGFVRGAWTLFDRDGNLWGVNTGKGIFRVRDPARAGAASATPSGVVEFFNAGDGLTSNSVGALAEDREGNVWVGTNAGLDRFRPANVVAEPDLVAAVSGSPVLLGASDGTVYVGVAESVYRIRPGGRPELFLQPAATIFSMCEGPDGSVWIVFRDEIARVQGERVTRAALPPTTSGGVYDCAVDDHNTPWLSAFRSGIFRRSGTGWEQLFVPPRPGVMVPSVMIADQKHRLLVHFSDALRRIDYPDHTDFALPKNSPLRDSQALYAGPRDILIGGAFGLARMRGDRIRILLASDMPSLGGAFGIVQSADETWLMARLGIVRMATEALDRAFDDPRRGLETTVLDFRDGLPGGPVWDGKREAVRGGDGRLWFATTSGVVWVDPARMARNPHPPRVLVSGLKAGGKSYRDPRRVILPAGTSSGEIDYTALSLAIPERVKFRYRLEGSDGGWVDPGQRRQMFFTNLGPGTYRFHVIAANNDGVWNREGATLEFTIPPTFLQSIWFQLICVALFAGLLWVVYSMRLRAVTAGLRHELEVRLGERERIARELHDTLLQGVQALVLRFQAVAEQIPTRKLRRVMDQALDQADATLIEGRDRVRELRSAPAGDVVQGLVDAAAALASEHPARFDFTVEGRPRALHPMVRVEIQRIGEEAMRNAFHHGRAALVEAILTYRSDQLNLIVRDDGIGLPTDVAATGGREGHFGLTGMRERAESIGGVLSVSSRAGAGTEVLLSIPGGSAYAMRRGGWRRWLPWAPRQGNGTR